MLKRLLNKINDLLSKQPLVLQDEYCKWLCYANAGMLHTGNIYCFDYAIKNLPTSNPILEIGSFCGLSTNVISYLLKKHKKQNQLVTSDKWIFEGAEPSGKLGGSEIGHTDYRDFVINTFKNNVSFFSKDNLPYPIEVFSDEFFELWKEQKTVKDIFNREIALGGRISFAYIDGNHTLEFAKRDFENTSEYLDAGGFILFDDSSDSSQFECAKLMKDILKNPGYELVMKNPNYLFKKIS